MKKQVTKCYPRTWTRAFTLVEMLVVIGLIALLSSVVLAAVNPTRQFQLARDSERSAHISALLNAIGQNISENKGTFMCGSLAKALPQSTTTISSDANGIELASCIIPVYLASIPYDPNPVIGHFTSNQDYNTGYKVMQDANGHISVFANSEMTSGKTISATR